MFTGSERPEPSGGAGDGPTAVTPRRVPALTATVTAVLAAVTVVVLLVFAGWIPLAPRDGREADRVFYVVPYHYGFAFYDRDFTERATMEVKAGEVVTLYVVPAQALPQETFHAYSERTLRVAIGDLPAGDSRIRVKIREDLALGNVEHIVGIAAHPVYLTTDVVAVLGGQPFRAGGPATLRDAIRQKDPAIRSVTFTAKRVGAFDVLCMDSGMDGAGTCGWGHKWMVAKGAFVVGP